MVTYGCGSRGDSDSRTAARVTDHSRVGKSIRFALFVEPYTEQIRFSAIEDHHCISVMTEIISTGIEHFLVSVYAAGSVVRRFAAASSLLAPATRSSPLPLRFSFSTTQTFHARSPSLGIAASLLTSFSLLLPNSQSRFPNLAPSVTTRIPRFKDEFRMCVAPIFLIPHLPDR